MKITKNDMLLYAVTDSRWTENTSLDKQVEEAILGGVTFVQLREKNLDDAPFIELSRKVKNITDTYKIPYVINDNINVAIEIDADGVHIGQSDNSLIETRKKLGNDKIIGVSVQTVEQALLAEKNGADYLGVGAIFSTNTKLDTKNVNLETLKEICNAVNIPVVGIGGIDKNNIELLKGVGISGIAVVSSIFAEKDIKKASENLLKLSKDYLEM
ncbi:MAG: thiamine phosphate synthase [Lachnospirales bacterium]